MKNETTKVEILENNKEILNKYLEKYNLNILDIVYLENHIALTYNSNKLVPTDTENSSIDSFHQMDVNIAIASAITAYGRIHMSYFKNNPDYKLFYSDTDNVVVDKALPDHMIGNELGQMKLEHTITKAVFLSSKVYGLIDTEGNEIIKVKGLTKDSIKDIKVSDLELLLRKDATRLFTQTKGYKQLFNANINVLESIYTLKVTSMKRKPIYVNGIFESTKPLNFDELKSNKLK